MVNTYLAVATSTLADMDRAVCVTDPLSTLFIFFFFHFSPATHFCVSPPLPATSDNPSHICRSFVHKSYVFLCSNRGNKDISKLSLLAVSLQDTSDAMGVTEVRQSCSRLREFIRVWNESERRVGEAGASIDGIIAMHERLKRDFALAKSWLTRFVETGNVPPDDGSTRGGAVMAAGLVASADPNSSW